MHSKSSKTSGAGATADRTGDVYGTGLACGVWRLRFLGRGVGGTNATLAQQSTRHGTRGDTGTPWHVGPVGLASWYVESDTAALSTCTRPPDPRDVIHVRGAASSPHSHSTAPLRLDVWKSHSAQEWT